MKIKNKASSWILRSSRPQLFNIIILAVIYAGYAFIGVYSTVYARELVNAAAYGRDLDSVILYGGLFLAVTVIQIVALIIARNLVFVVTTKLENSMRLKAFSHILNKDYADISAYHSGELMNRLNGDIGVVSSAITNIIPNIVFFIVKLIGVFYILVSIDALFALVFVVGGALVCAASALFKPYTKRLHKEVQSSDGKVKSFMQEGLGSLLMIKTFDAQDKMTSLAEELQSDNYRVKRKRNIFSLFTGAAMTSVFSFAFVWGMCWGAYMLFIQAITYGVLTQIITLVGQIRAPIQGISNIFPTYFNALASAERIIELEEIPDEEAAHSGVDVRGLYDRMKEIRFDDVSFSYGEDKVFDDASLTIKKGDFVAIEGISGIGKSTLLKLLLSVYKPSGGEIYIESGGKKYAVDKSLRRMFSYVPQGNFLLSGTLRENIAFIAPDATEADIMEAARIACADGFIAELENGLDTVIAERGGGLSEGQVQRIAIARAMLTGAKILLLDEATSALDEETEENLLSNLRKLDGVTCIIISHKKAAERICDRVVTIKEKKITVAVR